ncbi:MAG: hypothetical protein V4689_00815 [Verrucomicrobiota bacterium]
MSAGNPNKIAPTDNGSALLVARIVFYNGLVLGAGLVVCILAMLFFNAGNIAPGQDRWFVGTTLGTLAVLSFIFAWGAKARIAKLKKSA